MALTIPGFVLRRLVLLEVAGMAAVAGGAAYYFTHPRRVVVELPPDLAEAARHVHVSAQDGVDLHAVWLPGRSGQDGRPHDRTIVHHHGFNSSGGVILARDAFYDRGAVRLPNLPTVERGEPLFAWPLVRAGLARGYNFLLIDARGHGRSGGTWDTRGARQMLDLMLWTKWLREEPGQLWVGLWGNSFGSSVGLGLATRPAGGGIDAMVLDSPAVTAEGLYAGVLQRPFYLALQPVLRQLGSRDLLSRLGTERVWMPILLIHGETDRTVPAWQSERVYELIRDHDAPGRVELWVVPGVDHLESLESRPEEYIRRTLDWYDRWFG